MQARSQSYWEFESDIMTKYRPLGDKRQPTPTSTDVVIVGAGFCGSWLAYFLKKKHPSLKITLIERDYFNLGASARNAGFLSCGNMSEWLEDVKELGIEEALRTFQARMEGVLTIRSELCGSIKTEVVGSVDFDPVGEETLALMAVFNDYLKAQRITPFFETQERDFGHKKMLTILNTFDGQVDPCEILLALHQKLLASGVQIFWQTAVDEIGGGFAQLRTDAGTSTLSYGRAFVCVNAFAKSLHAATAIRPARGQILVTSPCKAATRPCLGFLNAGYDYFRFIGERVLVGGGRLHYKTNEDTDVIETSLELREYLTDFACRIIGHKDFKVDFQWAGIMGLRMGRHASIADLLRPALIDDKTYEVASCGGWGVTLTPYVAKQLANVF